MAKIKRLPSEAIISGFKGVIDFYEYMGQPCVRRWPRSPGHTRAAPVMAQWPIFTQATRLWAQLSPELRQAYNTMAQRSGLSGRDIHIRAYLSGFKRVIITPDDLP